jgi:hypothetical protein
MACTLSLEKGVTNAKKPSNKILMPSPLNTHCKVYVFRCNNTNLPPLQLFYTDMKMKEPGGPGKHKILKIYSFL